MSNGNGNGGSDWDEDWEVWVWTSGECDTRMYAPYFEVSVRNGMPGIFDKAEDIRGYRPTVTGGNETSCHDDSSYHYCGGAIDIDTGGWSPTDRQAFENYVNGLEGFHINWEEARSHFHIRTQCFEE